MLCTIALRSCALLMAAAASMFSADAVQWGAAVGGLQLGIVRTLAPEPGLRVILKNTSPVAQEIPIGFQDHEISYNVRITARTPRGDELAVFDLKTLARHVASCCGPGPEKIVRLDPGGIQEFTYPLSQLFVVNGTDMPLTKFLTPGCSVRATLRIRDTEIESPDLPLRK